MLSSAISNYVSSVASEGVGCVFPWARSWVSATEVGTPQKRLQPLVLYRTREGEEDTFKLLLNLILDCLHNQLVVVSCPSSSDQISLK